MIVVKAEEETQSSATVDMRPQDKTGKSQVGPGRSVPQEFPAILGKALGVHRTQNVQGFHQQHLNLRAVGN